MVDKFSLGDQIRETHIRFRKVDGFESYFNAIDEIMKQKMLFLLVIFTKAILLKITLLIDLNMKMVRILKMKLLNIEEIIVLYQQKGYCFVKCINYLTGEEYNNNI